MRLALAASLIAVATPALANDTTAVLGTGGLIFTRTDAIAMEREDLFISPGEVRVAYTFRNTSGADVESIVAFPMPDIESSPYANVAIPDTASDNFLGFAVTVDGKPVQPTLDQRAFAAHVDVTDMLRASGVPLFPYDDAIDGIIAAMSEAERADWIARGIVVVDTYDVGEGMKDHYAPTWTLKSTYWWRTNFPADRPIEVRHTYQPSVGGTVGVTFVEDGKVGGERLAEYRTKYCMDASFERAVQKAADAAGDGFPAYYENWISYVLTTGANWATSIGTFKLTIDKGEADSLVSFCGKGVKKTGPTTFEMTAQEFYPERDIDILILKKPEAAQ